MIGIIGAGKLGSVIASRLLESGKLMAGGKGAADRNSESGKFVTSEKEGAGSNSESGIIVSDRNKEQLAKLATQGLQTTADNKLAAEKSDALILCVKPKDIEPLLSEIGSLCTGKLVLSVAAGVSIQYLEKRLPGARIIRSMPNLAVAIGMSETALSCSAAATAEDKKAAEEIFSLLGSFHYIEEEKMAAWTGLSGSFPAFVALFLDSAAQVAQSEGFGKEESARLAASVARATASLLLETGEAPLALVHRVASPGGTTEAGLKVAQELKLGESVVSVLAASIARAKEMEK